jgi:hypothetical protein
VTTTSTAPILSSLVTARAASYTETMTPELDAIAAVLHDAAELHHAVWRDTDGEDPDWASWYADWLLGHSELPALLGVTPVRSHLVHALVELDRRAGGTERWEDVYARGLVEVFAA